MSLLEKFEDFIFPPACALCGDILQQEERYVCKTCRPMIAYPTEPTCLQCGCPVSEAEQAYCEDCSRMHRSYRKGFPAMLYQYPVDESIAAFKYHNKRYHAPFYADEIVKRHGRAILSLPVEALVPIPIHKKKREKRGYNQAELLAWELGKRLAIPVDTELIYRVENTEPQKTLSPLEREENLKKAFQCTKNKVSYKCVMLVDDIYTTGATIEACTKLLCEKGISDVYYTSICIGNGA